MLIDLIKEYYEKRRLSYPNFDNAMKFAMTEIAEVYELDLARIGGWVRNNPQDKPEFSNEALSEELGDAIMMLIVAGIAEGVNPIQSLENKIKRKLDSITPKVNKASITGTAEIVTQEEFEKYREKIYNGEA